MLSNKLRAGTVVLLADACHAGGIGWTSDPAAPSPAQGSLEALGAKDRAFLKLLASRPSERSFEDERWGGGHGVFTFSVFTALRGAAERERDGFVRVSELIDYVSRVVPEQTGAKQNPRIAGNFEGALPWRHCPADNGKTRPRPRRSPFAARLRPPYMSTTSFGSIRQPGELLMESAAGPHSLAVDMPGQETFNQRDRAARRAKCA